MENRSKQVRVVAGLLLIGGVGALLAGLIFIVGACHSIERDPKISQLTMKRGIVGTVVLAVSCKSDFIFRNALLFDGSFVHAL